MWYTDIRKIIVNNNIFATSNEVYDQYDLISIIGGQFHRVFSLIYKLLFIHSQKTMKYSINKAQKSEKNCDFIISIFSVITFYK